MAFVGVFSSIVTARVYGVHVVGQFALAGAPAGALWFLSTIKEQTALVRELTMLTPQAPRVTGLFTAVLAFSMALTGAVASIAAVVAIVLFRGPLHYPNLVAPALISLAGYTFITNLGWNFDGIFSAFVAGRQLFWIRLHESLAFLLLALVLGVTLDNVWGLVLATYGASASALLHRVVSVRAYMRWRVSRSELRDGFRALPDLLRFAVRMAPGTIMGGLTSQSGTWILGAASTLASVGAFNRAQTLTRRFQDLNTRIVEMLFPTLVSRRTKGDVQGFDRAFVDTMRYSAICMLLLGSVGAGAAHGIMGLLGAGFGIAADAFALLLLLPAMTALAIIQTLVLYAVGRPTVTSVIAAVRLVVTLAVGIVATRQVGILGPAIGLVVGTAIDVTWKAVIIRPHLGAPVRNLWPAREVCALGGAYAAGLVAARALDWLAPGLLMLPVALGAGTAAYAIAFVALGGLNARDRMRLRAISGRLARSRSGAIASPDAR